MVGEHPDFVILTIIEDEHKAVKEVFEKRTGKKFEQRADPNHPVLAASLELKIGGEMLFLVRPTNKGNSAAASLTRAIVDHWNPKYLLLVGIGGGVRDVNRLCEEMKGQENSKTNQSSLNIGDVVFSKSIYPYDYRNIENNKRYTRLIPIASPSSNLRGIAQLISENWEYNGSKTREGIILTGNAVVNNPKYARDIVCDCPQLKRERVLVFETEAGGVAQAIYDVINEKKPSFLVIRGISDFVDDPEGKETREKNKKLAAEAAAAFAYELIKVIGEGELKKRRENLKTYLDEAKRLFEERSPVDNKAPKEYYVSPRMIHLDKEMWNTREHELGSGEKWNVEEFLRDDSQWYVVIGASFGMGKTTYVKHLAHALADEFDRYGYVPLFVRLREWTEEEIKNGTVGLPIGKTVKEALEGITSAGARPLLILDGLDEFSGDYSVIYNWIQKLHGEHENLKVIVTTRLNAGIPEKLHIKSYVRPLGFSEEQVEEFFEKYGVNVNLDKLRKHIYGTDLSKPLFCWMIAVSSVRAGNPEMLILEDDDPNKRRAFFYYTVTHLLLRGKHLREVGKGLSLYEKEKEFLRLAAAYMNFMKYLERPETYEGLVKWIENFGMDLKEESSLEPFITSYFRLHETIKGKIVEFIHQSFQDYFLAEYYYENIVNGKYWRLNVGVPSRETLDFLEGLTSLSLDEKAKEKLRKIDENITGFLDERIMEKARDIAELDTIVLPPYITEKGFSESATKKEIWTVAPSFLPLSHLFLHRWIALEALGAERRWEVGKETLEYLIKNSHDFLNLFSLIGVDLSGTDLSEANLIGVDLSGTNLSLAKLIGANLRRADLSWADLRWTNLSEANLSKAKLSDAYLIRADLSWADLSKADLSKANLNCADLRGTDLSEADLSWANLRGVNLNWTDLRGTDLRGVVLGYTDDEIISTLENMDSTARSIILEQNPNLERIWSKYKGDKP